ncbi:MAG TPA: hypothetical protein VMV17_05080 [Streptosporangiaceae bacterium]|nr:hypothetical protein [Streptosporangiaceae bacterium]
MVSSRTGWPAAGTDPGAVATAVLAWAQRHPLQLAALATVALCRPVADDGVGSLPAPSPP